MDQFTAHLDRGWDLAQRGDASGAEASAHRALEIDAQSPEAHNLLGYSCALRGEYDEALEYYRQAIALDDTFLEAILNAAELCIHPLGSLDEAVALCDDALELAESDGERTDTLLLKFDALMGLGERDLAVQTLSMVPEGPYENPAHAFLLGRAFFEVGELARAEQMLLDASKREPENPDPPYFLALVAEQKGDVRAATQALLLSRRLDGMSPRPPWGLTRESFEQAAIRAAAAVTPRLRTYINPAEIYVAELPGIEAIVEGADPRAPLLVDLLDEESGAVRIFVYQNNIERMAGSLDRLTEEMRNAMEREVAALLMEEELSPPPDGTALN
jgi:Flp pilus assembly protein TadD